MATYPPVLLTCHLMVVTLPATSSSPPTGSLSVIEVSAASAGIIGKAPTIKRTTMTTAENLEALSEVLPSKSASLTLLLSNIIPPVRTTVASGTARCQLAMGDEKDFHGTDVRSFQSSFISPSTRDQLSSRMGPRKTGVKASMPFSSSPWEKGWRTILVPMASISKISLR